MAVKLFQGFDTSEQPGGSNMLDRLIRALRDSFDSMKSLVTNDKLVRVTLDNTKDWKVTHGLGHAPVSWEVVDQDANATVWRSKAVNNNPATIILLRASASVSVLLRFM